MASDWILKFGVSMALGVWCLKLPVGLELGVWSQELPAALAQRAINAQPV
jgi:hypothetical protein